MEERPLSSSDASAIKPTSRLTPSLDRLIGGDEASLVTRADSLRRRLGDRGLSPAEAAVLRLELAAIEVLREDQRARRTRRRQN